MKKLLVILSVSVLLFSSCSSDNNSTGARAEEEWNTFIQKHLIGEWNPQKIVIKPLLGAAVIEKSYPYFAGCEKDRLLLRKDYTGQFDSYVAQCQLHTTSFKWYHKLGELGFQINDNVEIKTILVHKSSKELVLAVPLKAVLPFLKAYIPEVEELEPLQIELLFVNLYFVK